MAKNKNRKIAAKAITHDPDAYAAMQKVTGYAPNNSDYALSVLTASLDAMLAAHEKAAQAAAAAMAAKDDEVTVEWNFHNLILGAKAQVVGQFGNDSNEVQSLGLKKASDRRAPVKKKDSQAF